MGFFSTSGTVSQPAATPTHPKISLDGTPEAPDRSARAHCWESRDAYFACLDKNSIVDSLRDPKLAREKCGSETQGFERDCATSWVQYFKKRRVMEFQKAETLAKIKREDAGEIALGGAMGDGVAGPGGVALRGK